MFDIKEEKEIETGIISYFILCINFAGMIVQFVRAIKKTFCSSLFHDNLSLYFHIFFQEI